MRKASVDVLHNEFYANIIKCIVLGDMKYGARWIVLYAGTHRALAFLF
jgi:hypothetical protein